MIQRLAVILPIVAACGGARPPKQQPAIPSPLYAGLFVEKAVYRYELVTSRSGPDPEDDESRTSLMTCTVGSVERTPTAIIAPLTCEIDAALAAQRADPSGVYVATADGLWQVESVERARLGTFRAERALLTAFPTERRRVDPNGVETEISRGNDGVWCVSQWWSSGDDGDTSVCFAGGSLDSGSASWSGGSSLEASYHRVR